ncbi:MAG: pilus assembly protein [Betaproteobacteria bacterium HGW-Betaproteobacteria-17]|nr:MAG: pilus assembly protein [Betaproteobacteria bacterium HGW-Betaproteobacteria-17]
MRKSKLGSVPFVPFKECEMNVETMPRAAGKAVSLNAGKHRQAGLTLLEAIAFLGISGLVIGGALAMYSSASSSQSTGQTVNEYQSFKTAVKSLYTTPSGYGTASLNTVLVPAKKVPASLTSIAPGTITNVWAGTVLVSGATAGSTFYVSYDKVPKDVCVGMIPAITASNDWRGYNVVVEAAAVGAMSGITAPVSPATAVTACANDSNKVTLWAS